MADEEQDGDDTFGAELEGLLSEVKTTRGVDLTGYKRSTLKRRIVRRMNAVGLDGDVARYADLLRAQPQELNALFDSLLINVTAFFRDREAWAYLAAEIIPRIADRQRETRSIRVWSAGCASGEEPFSVAMLLAEHLGLDEYTRRVKIYATDWDELALVQARRARYGKELEDVPENLRRKYFQYDNGDAVLHHALRRSVIFGHHDLLLDAPISRVDLLVCRNTLMYFNADAQRRILGRFHYALAEGGVLFLGRAEMLLTHADTFAPIEMKFRIFGKHGQALPAAREVPASTLHHARRRDEDAARSARLREAALDASPVAQIVLDPQRRIAVINQTATVMFPIGPPDLGRALQDLELSYRPIDLRSLLDDALEQRRSVQRKNVEYRPAGREVQFLDISVTPAYRDGSTIALTLTFADVTQHHRLQESLQRFSENLETAYEELQSTNEELETTNEELQSANEELETTNEELQAANEEMETVNEELRSTNEELQFTNDQLRQREIEVGHSSAFLNAILSSLRVAVAVVGEDLAVKVWNQLATELWGLRADEVIGKQLTDLDIGLPVKSLVAPIRECLAAPGPGHHTREMVVDAVNRRGRELACRVLLTPLASDDESGRAVCVLMEDSSARPGGREAEG